MEYFYICAGTLVLKGIMTRICQLLFVNTTFKVAPSSLTRGTRTFGGPTWLRHSKIGKYRQSAGSLQIQTPPHTSGGS